MNIFTGDNYQIMSKKAANDLIALIRPLDNPLLCTASGDTPAGLYKELVNEINRQKIDVSSWSFLGLDEWVGLNGDDEGSCRFHLNNQLFNPLQIQEKYISFFDGREDDLNKECDITENFIAKNGGIDVAILGLGMNGHIGMNEPGTSSILRAHVTELDSQTQKIGQKYFKKEQHLSKGITLGMATLMEAKTIFLLVSGAHKASIVHRVLQEDVSEQIPATLLLGHPGLQIYLDKEAAAFI